MALAGNKKNAAGFDGSVPGKNERGELRGAGLAAE